MTTKTKTAKTRKTAARKPAKAAAAKAERKVAAEPRMRAETAAIYEAAKNGKLPPAPDFSANTHAPYRAKLERLVAAAKAGDVKALKAETINPTSTSPKAMLRYRDWCVLALTTKPRAGGTKPAAAKKAAAKKAAKKAA